MGVSLFVSSAFSTFSALWQEVVGLARNVAPVAGAAGQQNKLPPPRRSEKGDVREHVGSVSTVIWACWELLRAARSGIKVDNLSITQHQGGRKVWLGAILPPSSTEQANVLARKLEEVDVEKKSRVEAGKKKLFCVYKKQPAFNSNKWISVPRCVRSPVSLRRWEENAFHSRNMHSSILNTNQFSWIDQVCFDQSSGWLFAGFCILFSVVDQWFWCQRGIFLDNWQQSVHGHLKSLFDFCTHIFVFFKMSGRYQHVVVRGLLSESPSDLQLSSGVNKDTKGYCRWHWRNLSTAPIKCWFWRCKRKFLSN